MTEPRAERSPEGDVVLRSMSIIFAVALQRLPALLSGSAPGVEDRMAPSPFPKGGEDDGDWERHAAPDLRHLFVTARETVIEDLAALSSDGDAWRLPIPARHMTAWLSALSAARVALGETHHVTADDMSRELLDPDPHGKDRALAMIHILGYLQELLVRAEGLAE